MKSLARAAATLIVYALAAPGCFDDVRLRDPGPFVIDDFEDGNLESELPSFDSWGCNPFNAQAPMIACGLVPGAGGSRFALNLDVR